MGSWPINFMLHWCCFILARFNFRFHKQHFLRKVCSCLFEIVVYFSVTNAKSGNQEVVCYHFHSSQILQKLLHGALSHFSCWTDAKWHLALSVLPKWCVERGFTYLKQMIYKFSVCLSWSRHYTLHINVKNAMEIGRAWWFTKYSQFPP